MFDIVVSYCKSNYGIGNDNKIPWNLKPINKRFDTLTKKVKDENKQNAVIMGKNTWNCIGIHLQNRIRIVVTQNEYDNCLCCKYFEEALRLCSKIANLESVYVIGGEKLFKEALNHKDLRYIYSTEIFENYVCDKYFLFNENFYKIDSSKTNNYKGINYEYVKYLNTGNKKKNHEEEQYLNLMKKILNFGNNKNDRTKTGTLSLFGESLEFSLENNIIPVLTTKKIFWRGIVEELLWILKGSTSVKDLQDKNVKFWNQNGTREYLDSHGFHDREEGDLGPVYGFQWRHFGADYTNMKENYEGKGVDQIHNIIEQITNNPDSRRIILCAWNPKDIKKMALPPCHMMAQFYVCNNELSCQMYQRSADVFLGLPFNITSYSLLTHILAFHCNLKAKKIKIVIGDAHIYNNHINACKTQILRKPIKFPTLHIKKYVKNIEDYTFEDFELNNYKCHPTIKAIMSA